MTEIGGDESATISVNQEGSGAGLVQQIEPKHIIGPIHTISVFHAVYRPIDVEMVGEDLVVMLSPGTPGRWS